MFLRDYTGKEKLLRRLAHLIPEESNAIASQASHAGERKRSGHRAKPEVLGLKASVAFVSQVGRVDPELAC